MENSMKCKSFTRMLSPIDRVHVKLMFDRNEIKRFALNYCGLIGGIWISIYRIDNFHGFLHEQHLWRTKAPIPLDDCRSLNAIVADYAQQIEQNYRRYRRYFTENDNHEKRRTQRHHQ